MRGFFIFVAYLNSMDYFTADWHLDHRTIIKYIPRREFMNTAELGQLLKIKPIANWGYRRQDIAHINISDESIQLMNETILNNVNEMVGPRDRLYILGDVGFFSSLDRIYQIFKSIRCGNIFIIPGNHDKKLQLLELSKMSLGKRIVVLDAIETLYKKRKENSVTISHYAMSVWPKSYRGAIQLYGHSHGCFEHKKRPRQMDVGVDAHGYRPISVDQVYEMMAPELEQIEDYAL